MFCVIWENLKITFESENNNKIIYLEVELIYSSTL